MSKYFVRLLITLVIVYLGSIVIFTTVTYRNNKHNLMKEIHTYLEQGAKIVTYLMPEGYFDRALDKDSIPEDEYQRHITRFTKACQSYGYKYLYALRNEGGNFYFIASSITPEQLEKGEYEPYWMKYEQVPAALVEAFTTRSQQFASYTDEWGSFYTCFLPQETDSGVFYITGADIEQESFHAMLRKNTLQSYSHLLALSLLLLPIFFINFKIRKVSERSLKFNAEMLSSAPLKCVVTDDKGNITFANEALLREQGMDESSLIGMNIHHKDLRLHPLFERISYCIDKQSKWEGDFLITDENMGETWQYAVINSARIRSSAKPVYYAFSQDITTLRLRTEQLNHNNIILKYLTHSMHMLLSNPDPYKVLQNVISDMGSCLTLETLVIVSKTDVHYKQIASWHRERLSTGVAQRDIPADVMPLLMDWENSLISGHRIHGNTAQFPPEFLNMCAIHNDLPVAVYPIKDDSRYWGFVVAIKTDKDAGVSEHVAENTLVTLSDSIAMAFRRYVMEDDLRRSTEAKSSFLSSISHEIRTPLNGILGMISLMNSTPLTEDQQDYLHAISTSGKQLQSLISDVLDISRIEAGKFNLHRTPVNMRSVVFVVHNIVQFQLNERGVDLRTHFVERLPDIIITDELRIKQILLNLVNNAIKFTPQGSIEVTIDMPEPGLLEIKVGDTGIGMTPEQQARVFQPFYQIETSGAKSQGSGLGLVITQRLVQLMQGTIDLASSPRKGTTFTVQIPVTDVDSRIR